MGHAGRYSGSAPALPGRTFVSGRYYTGSPTGADGTTALTQGTEVAVRFEVGTTTTFDRIGIEVATGAASAVIRLGVRYDSGDGQPGELLLDAGTVDASANAFVEATISQVLTPGRWWVSATLQVAGGVSVRTRNVDSFIGQTTTATHNSTALTATGRTGALPQSFGATTVSQTGAKVLLRAA